MTDQRLQLHSKPQYPATIFQVSDAERCGVGQGNKELAFVHNVKIILQRAVITKTIKPRPGNRGSAVTARDEANLDALTGELARVVQETLQPEGVSVWLQERKDRTS
ncbi:MAG: hypothetical protein WAU95_00630 [Anaerolineae bacterium]